MPYDRCDRVGSPCCWRGLLGYLGFANLKMKRLVQFCIRFGFLPRRRWFADLVRRELWRPADPRDHGLYSGWIEIGPNASRKTTMHFLTWWYSMYEPPKTTGDRQK